MVIRPESRESHFLLLLSSPENVKGKKANPRRKPTSASSVWSLWALSELTSESLLRFSRLLERVEGVSQKIA
jgi:hypothetical protein